MFIFIIITIYISRIFRVILLFCIVILWNCEGDQSGVEEKKKVLKTMDSFLYY